MGKDEVFAAMKSAITVLILIIKYLLLYVFTYYNATVFIYSDKVFVQFYFFVSFQFPLCIVSAALTMQ